MQYDDHLYHENRTFLFQQYLKYRPHSVKKHGNLQTSVFEFRDIQTG